MREKKGEREFSFFGLLLLNQFVVAKNKNMKKKITLLGLAFIFSFQTFPQILNWDWANSSGGANYDYGTGISIDANGNNYVTGWFKSTSIAFGSTTLINAGDWDIFIAKHDSSGNIIWAQQAGGSWEDVGNDICTDLNNHIYLTGEFQSPTITFGSTILSNTGSSDFFLTKYDSSGNIIWARSAIGASTDFGNGVCADADGNVYATGYFYSSTITFGSFVLTNAGHRDIFIVKYDSSGNVLWAKSAGGVNWEDGNSITTDGNGNAYVTGIFTSSAIIFGIDTLVNAGAFDVFVVKYDSSGNTLWAKSGGGSGTDIAYSIYSSTGNTLYLTGYFTGPSITFGSITLNNPGIFVTKYDSSGNVLWANEAIGGASQGNCVTADGNDNSYVTGNFSSNSIAFGSIVLTNSNPGSHEIFVTKYDVSGNVIWAIGNGGSLIDESMGISVLGNSSIYVTGRFWSPSISFGSTTLINAGFADILTAKLMQDFPTIITHELYPSISIQISPNPATTEVTINFGKAERYDVLLCNTLGEILFQTTTNTEQMEIDVRDFSKGIYFVSVRDEKNNLVVRKIVKM